MNRQDMSDSEFGEALLCIASDIMTDEEKKAFKIDASQSSSDSCDMCPHCGGRMIANNTEMVCDSCGITGKKIQKACSELTHSTIRSQTRRRIPREQRLRAHFSRALSLFEGTLHVSGTVMEKTRCELARRRLSATYDNIKLCLGAARIAPRRIAPCVARGLGVAIPQLSGRERECILQLFAEARCVIERVALTRRKKQLAYTYIASQLLQQSGMKDKLLIHNIETPQNLLESNETWRAVCAELGWKFVPL